NTDDGALAITPGYSPPEQYTDAPTDAQSDVYSVGATLYFLLTGQVPAAADDRESRQADLVAPTALLPGISDATESLVLKALNLDPAERWPSAAAMRQAVGHASQQLVLDTANDGSLPDDSYADVVMTSKPRYKRSKGRVGLALLLCLVAIGLAAAGLIALNGNNPAASDAIAFSNQTGSPEAPDAANADGVSAVDTSPAERVTMTASENSANEQVAELSTATPPPVPAVGIVAAASVEATEQSGVAAAAPPTSTPITLADTSTATPTPSPTATSTATSTPTRVRSTPTIRPTLAPSPSPKPATATPNVATSDGIHVTIINPASGSSATDAVAFQWQWSSGILGQNQAFEVRLWKPGQDPLANGLGLAGWTRDSQQTINLQTSDAALGSLFDPGEYNWGVLLVNTAPSYSPIGLISEAQTITYQNSSPAGPADNPTPTAIP
ncbi:MAG: hypothetical protein KDE45_25470, partial [Caldilineaceae bacterium]|nr:hypothetical protein [Caldilineaceae bacterium]